jgi:EAL domain-containing protein (putative c-di-GMP-specific phosphodiesterase class I)
MSSAEAVGDIITYLNRREFGTAGAISNAAHDRPLYSVDQRIHADYAGLRLDSLFQPVVRVDDEVASIGGYEALLAIRTIAGLVPLGPALSPQSLFALPHNREEIIALDRLTRTLHALNFLIQGCNADLHLNVDPHHLVAVTADHGQVFEQILRQCGLDPTAIILEVSEHCIRDKARLRSAIASWQSRGYRIAIDNFNQPQQLQRVLGLRPDFIKLERGLLHAAAQHVRQRESLDRVVAGVQAAGVDVIAAGIETAGQYDLACKLGITRLQGFFLGRPAQDCKPTVTDTDSWRRYA